MAELAYAYGSEPYSERIGSSNLPMPTERIIEGSSSLPRGTAEGFFLKQGMSESGKDKIKEAGEQYDKIVGAHDVGKVEFFKTNEDFGSRFIQEQLHKHLGNPAGKVLLDEGCGSGDETVQYEHMGFAAVYGIEPSAVALEQARGKVTHPENFQRGTYEDTGYPSESFDAIEYPLHTMEEYFSPEFNRLFELIGFEEEARYTNIGDTRTTPNVMGFVARKRT